MKLYLLVPVACLAQAGCGAIYYDYDELAALPRSEWESPCRIPIERGTAKVNAAVPRAAKEMELSVEVAPGGDGGTWILARGGRGNYPPIAFRVDVDAVDGHTDRSRIHVAGRIQGRSAASNGETLVKPGELAFRIVTLSLEE